MLCDGCDLAVTNAYIPYGADLVLGVDYVATLQDEIVLRLAKAAAAAMKRRLMDFMRITYRGWSLYPIAESAQNIRAPRGAAASLHRST